MVRPIVQACEQSSQRCQYSLASGVQTMHDQWCLTSVPASGNKIKDAYGKEIDTNDMLVPYRSRRYSIFPHAMCHWALAWRFLVFCDKVRRSAHFFSPSRTMGRPVDELGGWFSDVSVGGAVRAGMYVADIVRSWFGDKSGSVFNTEHVEPHFRFLMIPVFSMWGAGKNE